MRNAGALDAASTALNHIVDVSGVPDFSDQSTYTSNDNGDPTYLSE